jgi:hypothetical protein
MNTNDQSPVRWLFATLALLAFAGLLFGLSMLGPDLVRNLGRLEPWQLALVLVGDGVVLFWFLVFVTRHSLLGEPFPASDHPAGMDQRVGVAVFSLVAALILDLMVTIYLQTDESLRFASAEVADGDCHTLRPRRGQQSVSYDLGCRFQDKAGNWNQASFYVGGIRNNQNDDLSPDLLRALLKEQVPFPVKISYDPQRPARVWLTGLGGRYHGWNIHILSNLFIFMQIHGLLIFFALLASYRQQRGHNPWWLGLHKVLPFVVQATGVTLMGIAELIRP